MAVNPEIKKLTEKIRHTGPADQVRESIAGGMDLTSEEASATRKLADQTENRQTKVESDFKTLQQEYTENGNGAQTTAEISLARDGELVLADRLNRDFGNITAQFQQIHTNISNYGAKPIEDTSGFDSTQALLDATNDAVYNSVIGVPSGTYKITKPYVAKSGVSFKGIGKVIFEIECEGLVALSMHDLEDSVWENITVKRVGSGKTNGNQTAWGISGSTKDSVVLKYCDAINDIKLTDKTQLYAARGFHIFGQANPILDHCRGYGGEVSVKPALSIGISIGATHDSVASPKMYSCEGFHSPVGFGIGIELCNTKTPNNARLYSCIGHSQGSYSRGISVDDLDQSLLYNCEGYGSEEESTGIAVYSGASPKVMGGKYRGGKGENSHALYVENGNPVFDNINFESGVMGSCITTRGNSITELNKCKTSPKQDSFKTFLGAELSTTVTPPSEAEYVIKTLDVSVNYPLAAGTLNIGTEPGGSDIYQGVDLTKEGWQTLNISNIQFKKARAVGTKLHLTVVNGIGMSKNFFEMVGVCEHTTGGASSFGGKAVLLNGSNFLSGQKSVSAGFNKSLIDNNISRIIDCTFETRENETNTQKETVWATNTWPNSHFHNCTFIGKISNLVVPGELSVITLHMDSVKGSLVNENCLVSGTKWTNFPHIRQGYIEGYNIRVDNSFTDGEIKVKIKSNTDDLSGVPEAILKPSNGFGQLIRLPIGTPLSQFKLGSLISASVTTPSTFTAINRNLIVQLFVRYQ